jgi:pyridinium-3,5-biscarboxylic acid mononucleotide synthase
MDEAALNQLLIDVAQGDLNPDDAVRELRRLPFSDLGFARIDHHRSLRTGMAETVYAPGKTPQQCAAIVGELLDEPDAPVLLTRADPDQAEAASATAAARGYEVAGRSHPVSPATLTWRPGPERVEKVVVVTAGTADLPVASECLVVLEALGCRPALLADCGVAGLHRLLASVDTIAQADAVVVVAGMEGALASVVGGLTAAPVVAVPTSVGYGSSLEGVTALLAMLSSCASGITVVGVDNGFGAACFVGRLLR